MIATIKCKLADNCNSVPSSIFLEYGGDNKIFFCCPFVANHSAVISRDSEVSHGDGLGVVIRAISAGICDISILCFSGGSGDCGELAMTESLNDGLRYKNFITNGTMLTCGKTCFCTGGSDSVVGNFSMT